MRIETLLNLARHVRGIQLAIQGEIDYEKTAMGGLHNERDPLARDYGIEKTVVPNVPSKA
jgi:hypothetical protein